MQSHSNGCTSYFNRWNTEQHTPLCEFGEAVQHMLPTVKQFPKLEPRFYNGIWLGKDTTADESLPGRTIRRQHRSLENTSISTAYNNLYDTTDNASYKSVKHHHHRRMRQHAQQQKARDRTHHKQVTSRQNRRRQQSPPHQWLHHQRIRSDQRCQHRRLQHSQEKEMTQWQKAAYNRRTTERKDANQCHQVYNK